MSNKLLATTAILALLSTPAFAENTDVSADTSVDAGVEAGTDQNNDGTSADVGADADVDASADTETGDSESNTDANVDAGVDADADVDAGVDAGVDASVEGTANQNANTGNASASTDMSGNAMVAADVMGEEVYTSANAELQMVGEVNDVVMNDEGQATQIIVGVGGFLGIGEKEIALSADQVAWAEVDGNKVIVTEKSEAELKSAAEVDRSEIEANAEVSADDLSWTAEGEARLNAEASTNAETE